MAKNAVEQIDKKQYRKNMTTPRGTARFPALTNPDTAFAAEGEYHTGIILNPEDPDVKKMFETIKEYTDSWYNEVYNALPQKDKKKAYAHYPWEEEYDDDDNPTGNIIVKFRQKAVIKNKKDEEIDMQPDLVDAKKRAWPGGTPVGHGSIIRIGFQTWPYYVASSGMCGIKLRLSAVQVIKLVKMGGASSFGFEDESDEDDEGDNNGFSDESTNDDDGEDDIPF